MADSDIKKSNILVVDDEREHAQVMCEALTRLGHKCDVTYNRPEAEARLKELEDEILQQLHQLNESFAHWKEASHEPVD